MRRPEPVAEGGSGGGVTRNEFWPVAGMSALAERVDSMGFGEVASLKRVNSCRLASSLRARAAALSKVRLFGSLWRVVLGVEGVLSGVDAPAVGEGAFTGVDPFSPIAGEEGVKLRDVELEPDE